MGQGQGPLEKVQSMWSGSKEYGQTRVGAAHSEILRSGLQLLQVGSPTT